MTDLLELARKSKTAFSLDNRKALVVGGNKGLGQAMAYGLAAAGADVSVAARGPDGFDETVAGIQSLGRAGHAYPVDAGDEEQVAEMMKKFVETHGRIDILVNSQGTVHLQPAAEFPLEEYDRVMRVNVRSLVITCKHAGAEMLKHGYGKIINISSVRAFQGRAQDLAYAPSKGAVNQLIHSLAIEWGPRGINVNGIAPCFVLTEISAPFLADPAKRDWALGRIPMKRFSTPDDLFGPVVFLASDASTFINGHIIPVDGGWLSA